MEKREMDILVAPGPWTLRGDVYILSFWIPKSQGAKLPHIAYSPLELDSSFASPQGGRCLGGLSMIQLVRYKESPVGPYDELIIAPGTHEYVVEENGKQVTKRAPRMTRLYVSQKDTCWNCRKNWNIPKHLAKFDWQTTPDGATSVKVFPLDTSGDAAEATVSERPFLRATFKPIPYLPSFPMSLGVLKYFGVDASVVQPPLPQGEGSQGELPGTERWCKMLSGQYSPNAKLGWLDMSQAGEDGKVDGEFENFWPGFGRWKFGVFLPDAIIDIPIGTHWDPPKSVL